VTQDEADRRRTLYRLRIDWADGHQTWSAVYNTAHEARIVARGLARVSSIWQTTIEGI